MNERTPPHAPVSGFDRRGVDLPDGHISYQVGGSGGPPVVLLHGASLDNGSITWRHVAYDLASDYRVYSPDLPKHGGSWPWRGRADQRGLESAVLGPMDAWGLESAVLVGLSMGAAAGLGTALNHPERVDALVLASCGGIQERVRAHELSYLSLRTPVSWALTRLQSAKSLENFARKNLPFADGVSGEYIEFLASAYLAEYQSKRRNGGHLFSDWNRFEVGPRGMRTNYMPRTGELECPTLFIHGEHDDAVPGDAAVEAASRSKNGRVEFIGGASHFLPQDHPEETAGIVRRFLDGLGP